MFPIANEPVKINETEYNVTTVSPDGRFSLTLNIPSEDNKSTTYMVTASFEGTNPCNASAYDYTLNGTQYAVCTTVKYGYKPVSNSTWLIVNPDGTTQTQPTKTPEEMQQEAMQNGTLSIWPEFSWWYPWFRLHLGVNINLPQGNPAIDYGWSPLPFGESYSANDNVIAEIINEFASLEFKAELLMAPIITILIQYIAARVAGMMGFGVGLAIALYAGISLVTTFAFYLASGQNPKSWLGAFLGSAISCTMGLVLKAAGVVKWLTSVARLALGQVSSVINSMHALRLNFFDITGIAFALVDFTLMIVYLGLYLASMG